MVMIMAVNHSAGTCPFSRHVLRRVAMALWTFLSELKRISFVRPDFPPVLPLPNLANLFVTSSWEMCLIAAGPLYCVGGIS